MNTWYLVGPVAADHTISDWCSNSEPGNVLRVGHFNDDNNADLLCVDTNNGNSNRFKLFDIIL